MRSQGKTFEHEDFLKGSKGGNRRGERGAIAANEAERYKGIAKIGRLRLTSDVTKQSTIDYCSAKEGNQIESSYRRRHILVLLYQHRIHALV